MITVLFSMTIKPGRGDECVKTAKEQMSTYELGWAALSNGNF